MKSDLLAVYRAGALVIALGLANPVLAQDAGPMPPTPASQASADQAPAQNSSAPAPAAASSSATAQPPANTPPVPAAASKGAQIQVPSGTHIPLLLHNAISTRSARPGDPVYLETLFPIMANGQVAIPAGSYISGEVTQSKRAGRVKGRAQLAIKLTTMILPNSYTVDLNATPSNAGYRRRRNGE